MGKLHETLAVEATRKKSAEAAMNLAAERFTNYPQLYLEHDKVLSMLDEADKSEEGTTDYSAMTSTVPHELNKVAKAFVEYLDVVYQKELANTDASSELDLSANGIQRIVDGIPATFLLGLETKLSIFRKVIHSAPTHATGVEWKDDENFRLEGVVRLNRPEITNKTKSVLKPFILHKATKEHPAQVEKLKEDVVVGKYENRRWSGMLRAGQKAEMLKRLDRMMEMVKVARQKANQQESPKETIGDYIMTYILGSDIRDMGELDEE